MARNIRLTIAGILTILFVSVFGTYALRSIDSENSVWKVGSDNEPLAANVERTVSADANEYSNQRYGFSILYPRGMKVTEHDESSDVSTIVFEDIDLARGFQLFVMPYDEEYITSERFRKDVPSGVQTNLHKVEISGVTGAAFYSEDAFLGETYEIWFIHNGYLYEINTFRTLEKWINEIVQTLIFI